MRKLACFLLLLSGSAALQAAETWRWVDASGVVHFSDRPVPGAERVDLGSRVVRPSEPPPGATPGMSQGDVAASRTTDESPEGPRIQPYTRCVVERPLNDEVFQGVQNVAVSLSVQPGLQADHRIEVQLNGSVVNSWPPTSLRHELTEMYRGSYTLTVRILDLQGRPLCTGPGQVFHVRQPSIFSPARPRS